MEVYPTGGLGGGLWSSQSVSPRVLLQTLVSHLRGFTTNCHFSVTGSPFHLLLDPGCWEGGRTGITWLW